MDKDDIEFLHTTLYIGLTVARYRRPKAHDRSALDAYRRSIADVLVEHLKRSWELKKKPPAPRHSSP
jgi:hypothetical protein